MIKDVREAIAYFKLDENLDTMQDLANYFEKNPDDLGHCIITKTQANNILGLLQQQEKEKQELISSASLKGAYEAVCYDLKEHKKEIKELKEQLDKWKPKFEINQEVWVESDINEFKQYTVRKILFDDLEGEDVQYHLCNITKNPDGTTDYDYLEDFINQSEIYATKEEAEQARGE